MIKIETSNEIPLYQQIYTQLKTQILDETILNGEKLLSTRALAEQLQVSRNTVDKAYSQLLIEGYIDSVIGSGFFVKELPKKFKSTSAIQTLSSIPKKSTSTNPNIVYDLTNSSHTSNLFPKKSWRKYYLQAMDTLEKEERISSLQAMEGEMILRENLLLYLKKIRGVNASVEQLIITSGLQQSIDYLCKIIPKVSSTVLIEDPSYPKARVIFENNQLSIATSLIDEDGIIINDKKLTNQFDLIYTTPSHQFPTGITMSISRRHELLNFANKTQAFIIEDDYDSELRYYHKPVPALQSIDDVDRVVYLGTFSKILSPSLRMGYMILPKQLVTPFKKYFSHYNSTVNLLNQHTVSNILEAGEYDKIIRRMNTVFKKRFEKLNTEFASFKRNVSISNNLSGQYVLAQFDKTINQEEMIQKALVQGVKVYPTMEFWQDKADCPDNALFLGFSKIQLEDIEDCVNRLKLAWDE